VVYSCHEGTSNRYLHKIGLDGSFHFYYYTSTRWQTRTGFIEDNKWYHYAFTRNDGTFTFYINGIKVSDDDIVLHNASATKNPLTGQPNYVYTSTTRFNIGQEWDSSPSDHWRGMMKNIYFWDREITEDEVYSVYHNFGISMNNFKRKVLKDYTIVPGTSMSINSHFKNKTFIGGPLYGFSLHTFTSCGASTTPNQDTNDTPGRRIGPTLAQCTSTYSSTSWASNTDYFNMTTQGIQEWTVPKSGTYRISAKGGAGGDSEHATPRGHPNSGGKGAIISGDFDLEKGEIIKILVGHKGETARGTDTTSWGGGGGGGGSFVVRSPYNIVSSILVIAGGGGGGNDQGMAKARCTDAIITIPSAADAANYAVTSATTTNWSSGGGGSFINNGGGSGGKSFTNGGEGNIGGYSNNSAWIREYGGFGGGGGNGAHEGGGGGGLRGGNTQNYASYQGALGGDSYNTGTNQTNVLNSNYNEDGSVTITLL
jgi:hypothetical protein